MELRPDRSEGSVSDRRHDQERARLGRAEEPGDLPAQSARVRHAVQAAYALGPPTRPSIRHDNGHLDSFPPRAATLSDRASLVKWRAMLAASEAARPDLTDANAAYRHFLDGAGRARTFSYDRYVGADRSGRVTRESAIREGQAAAFGLWSSTGRAVFAFTGSAIACSADNSSFPYPATENWQKAIGAHYIWLSGSVEVRVASASDPEFTLHLVVHAEDRYNFNPGAADIATGLPDAANGVFELTGLAHQFDQFATWRRTATWTGEPWGTVTIPRSEEGRVRQPSDNRRLRNRI